VPVDELGSACAADAPLQILFNMGKVLDQGAPGGDSQALREAAICYGEAWALQPKLTEALFSKGYVLHRVSGTCRQHLACCVKRA
jgi:hypothetical protein